MRLSRKSGPVPDQPTGRMRFPQPSRHTHCRFPSDHHLGHDPFLVLADYQAYVDCQARASALWRAPESWTRQSILNAARLGKFSYDRCIHDYYQRVWHIQPVTVAKTTAGFPLGSRGS